jgi:hypothetical protein
MAFELFTDMGLKSQQSIGVELLLMRLFESLVHFANQLFRERGQCIYGALIETAEYRNTSIRHDFVVSETIPSAFFLRVCK